MTKTYVKVLIVTARERQTHGFKVGQLVYDTSEERMYRLRSRNPHVWGPIDSSFYMKTGKCEFVQTTLKGEGMMADIQSLGTFVGKGMDANGTNQSWSTGTAAVVNAGVGILPSITSDFTGLTRTNWLPHYRIKGFVPAVSSIGSSADTRFYSGWIKNSVGPTIGDNPLPQAEGGIIVGFGANDTTWQVWHGDGTATISKDPLTSVPVLGSITQYRIEMMFTTATNIIVTVYNSSDTVLQTITINSNVLASAKTINWVHCIQNPTQVNKTIHCHKAEMRATL